MQLAFVIEVIQAAPKITLFDSAMDTEVRLATGGCADDPTAAGYEIRAFLWFRIWIRRLAANGHSRHRAAGNSVPHRSDGHGIHEWRVHIDEFVGFKRNFLTRLKAVASDLTEVDVAKHITADKGTQQDGGRSGVLECVDELHLR